ncbi:MAG: amidase family protein [Gammaproteobacteria bacterium]
MSEVAAPDPQDVAAIASGYALALTPAELEAITSVVGAMCAAFDGIGRMAPLAHDLVPPTGRRESHVPAAGDNPLGAWYRRCAIRTHERGPLAGRTVAVKDSIAVGGVPLANGSAFLEGYVPDFDATVVTRVLEAGGTIAGKAVCEPMCMSSFGNGAHTGPVRNPHDPAHAPGGSSSGCAALVGARAVDMAIGGDNGGSIRIPSSWCGVYGLKPSWGLVPYTGAFAMVPQGDHLGPMASDMADLELLLGVLAGPDGLDPRQRAGLALGRPAFGGVHELRVGVLREGFAWPGKSEPDADAAVEQAIAGFAKLGARVAPVSIPLHRDGAAIMGVLGAEMGRGMFDDDAIGGPFLGWTSPSLTAHYHGAWRSGVQSLSLPSKVQLIASRYLLGRGVQPQLALARNLALVLQRAYDAALRDVDVLAMPTVTHKPKLLPRAPLAPADELAIAWDQSRNTRPFNLTGHPALNVPCAEIDGLPIGLELVGRRGEDATVVRAGRIFADRIFAPGG